MGHAPNNMRNRHSGSLKKLSMFPGLIVLIYQATTQFSGSTPLIASKRSTPTVPKFLRQSSVAASNIQGNRNNSSLKQQILRLSSSALVVGMTGSNGSGNNNNNNRNSPRAIGANAGAVPPYYETNPQPPGEIGQQNSDGQIVSPVDVAPSPSLSGEASAQSLTSSFSSLFSLPTFQYDGNFERLVIPLAGITLLSAFLVVLIVNYFLHMRRNGFFKRHQNRTCNRNRLVDKPSDNNSTSNGRGEDKEKLMANRSTASNNADLLDATPDVTSNFDLPIDPQLSFDLPPMPSPQLDYRPFFPHPTQAFQQHQQHQQLQQQHDRTPSPPLLPQRLNPQLINYPSPPPLPPKMSVVVVAAQQQHQQQQQIHSNNSPTSVTPITAGAPSNNVSTSPKANERRAGILAAAKRPSMSSIRSHSNNNSFNNRGSSERIVSVQESFDSAYEVRLYDELAVDPSSIGVRNYSKRAPLLKGESLSDDPSVLPTPIGGKKVPQTLIIASDASTGSFFSRQPSVGGDLSPVQEQPTHDEHTSSAYSNSTSSPAQLSVNACAEKQQQQKIRFNTDSDAQPVSKSNNNGQVLPSSPVSTPPKQKSLLSIFKEKRVTLLEHVRAISPTKSEHPPPLPPAPHHNNLPGDGKSANMTMANRPTDLIHHPTPAENARIRAHQQQTSASGGNLVTMGGNAQQTAGQNKMMSMNQLSQGGMGMGGMVSGNVGGGRGQPLSGRGRARNTAGMGTINGPVNANMLMGRMGNRMGDS